MIGTYMYMVTIVTWLSRNALSIFMADFKKNPESSSCTAILPPSSKLAVVGAMAEAEAIVEDERECYDKNQGLQSTHQVSIYSMHDRGATAAPSFIVQ